jgi:hypothetical protein
MAACVAIAIALLTVMALVSAAMLLCVRHRDHKEEMAWEALIGRVEHNH